MSAESVVRAFIDTIIDGLYRRNAHPGPCRGWELNFAESLRSENAHFQPLDARHHSIPSRLAEWSAATEASALQLVIRLSLSDQKERPFLLNYFLCSTDEPSLTVPVTDAWRAGKSLNIEGQHFDHPAYATVRMLARAARIYKPLAKSLEGSRPNPLKWTPDEAWRFLEEGRGILRASGFLVEIPEAFRQMGHKRVHAQIRLHGNSQQASPFAPETHWPYTWELALGNQALQGTVLEELLSQRSPLAYHEKEWILLDPHEVRRLPTKDALHGTLSGPEVLNALLTGKHDDVSVVANPLLIGLLEKLRGKAPYPCPEALQTTLRSYQKEGYSWLCLLGELGLGACLADDMGLGKTVQLIAYLAHRAERQQDRPSLIVCPTSIMQNWSREIARFAPSLRVLLHHGLERDLSQVNSNDIVITTYSLLIKDRRRLAQIPWDVVTLDEAQAIKNPSSRRSQAAREMSARHRVILTGTPIENRLEDLWALFSFTNPQLLGPHAQFMRERAIPIERFGDSRVAQSLRQLVQPFLMRRLKTDPNVINDLPEKIERRVYSPLGSEQHELYERVSQQGLLSLRDKKSMERRGHILAMLTKLKQICNHPSQFLGDSGPLEDRSSKFEQCMQLVETIASREEYTIVFSQYREMGDRLQRGFQKRFGWEVPFLHGGAPIHVREQIVADFQSTRPRAPVLIISLRAGGTGLNLTRATHVIHYDRWWNPAVEDQATDRAYRIGQHQTVQVYKMVCPNTLEERIDMLLSNKRALAERVVTTGESWITELDNDALEELISLKPTEGER